MTTRNTDASHSEQHNEPQQQEWTAEWLANFGKADDWLESICDAHNAALTAERQRAEQAEQEMWTMRAGDKVKDDQLLSALAAIEKHNAGLVYEDQHIKVDLSLLREHDAELTEKVRKPLVDEIEQLKREIKNPRD